jgi:hypothetical protein
MRFRQKTAGDYSVLHLPPDGWHGPHHACGLLVRALGWCGQLDNARWFLWIAFVSFPTGFVAVLAGWFTAEVGRQPWVVYGLLRTKDAVTPSLTTGDVAFSLLAYIAVYAVIYAFGFYYIYRLLRDGPPAAAEGPGDSTLARVPAVAMRAAPVGGGDDSNGTLRLGTVLGCRHRRRHRRVCDS